MKISEPFRQSGMWFKVGDYQFALRCPCGADQRANELRTRVSGEVTLYECPHCSAILAGIALDDRTPVPGAQSAAPPADEDGHRMCGFVFGSTVDMLLFPPAAAEEWMTIPARPGFFSARGCA